MKKIHTKQIKNQPNQINLFICIILIIIVGFIIYENSLKGEFIWDDYYLVKDNVYIRNLSNIPKIFKNDLGSGSGERYGYYRPMQVFTYLIDYSLWELNVVGYHLTNIILHILVTLGIWWFVILVFKDRFLSLLTSLLFITHPIHTQAVSYISGRADSLALLFMLLCLIFYIKNLDSGKTKFYILMILSYILAILSRENSLVLPFLLILYHYTFKKKIKLTTFLVIFSLTFSYIILRFVILKILFSHYTASTMFQRIPGFLVAITSYTKLLLLPSGLHMEYGDKIFRITNPKALLGFLILFSSLVYALKKRRANPLVLFSVFWFLIALSPVYNLYPVSAYMAEHWLYVPSIGVFLIMANLFTYFYRVKGLKKISMLCLICILTFYSYSTIRQNDYWKDAVPFYERALKYSPQNDKIHNNLGLVYRQKGNIGKAEALYKKAIELNPRNVNAYNNLANLYQAIGNDEEAIDLYKKAIEINSNYAMAYYNLGLVYYNMGNKEEAKESYKKAIEINRDNPFAHNQLARLYYYEKEYDLAIKHLDIAGELGHPLDNKLAEELKSYRK